MCHTGGYIPWWWYLDGVLGQTQSRLSRKTLDQPPELCNTVTLSPTRDQWQSAKLRRLSAKAASAEDLEEEDWMYSLNGI